MIFNMDLEEIKERLTKERDELLANRSVRQEAGETVELDQARTGRLSRMDAMQGQAMAQAAQQRAELRLKRIESALRRIDDETYGDCLRCEEPIDPRRLEADPSIPLCLKCAELKNN